MTDVAILSPIERIARVLAAETLSPNAGGTERSEIGGISARVDDSWRGEIARAVAVLKTMREPSPEMLDAGAQAGDDVAEIWNAMVRAAIGEGAELAL